MSATNRSKNFGYTEPDQNDFVKMRFGSKRAQAKVIVENELLDVINDVPRKAERPKTAAYPVKKMVSRKGTAQLTGAVRNAQLASFLPASR